VTPSPSRITGNRKVQVVRVATGIGKSMTVINLSPGEVLKQLRTVQSSQLRNVGLGGLGDEQDQRESHGNQNPRLNSKSKSGEERAHHDLR
jgi:hypothetical protein